MLNPQHLFNASCSHTMTTYRVPGILTWRGPSSCNEKVGISLSQPIMATWIRNYHFHSPCPVSNRWNAIMHCSCHWDMLESDCKSHNSGLHPVAWANNVSSSLAVCVSLSVFLVQHTYVLLYTLTFTILANRSFQWITKKANPYNAFVMASWNAFTFRCAPLFSDVSLTLLDDISISQLERLADLSLGKNSWLPGTHST